MRHSMAELEEFRRQIGRRIAELRKAHNPPWTQFDLASASGCRPEAISRIERGAVDFGISNIYKISRALAVSPERLIAPTPPGDRNYAAKRAQEPLHVHERPVRYRKRK